MISDFTERKGRRGRREHRETQRDGAEPLCRPPIPSADNGRVPGMVVGVPGSSATQIGKRRLKVLTATAGLFPGAACLLRIELRADKAAPLYRAGVLVIHANQQSPITDHQWVCAQGLL